MAIKQSEINTDLENTLCPHPGTDTCHPRPVAMGNDLDGLSLSPPHWNGDCGTCPMVRIHKITYCTQCLAHTSCSAGVNFFLSLIPLQVTILCKRWCFKFWFNSYSTGQTIWTVLILLSSFSHLRMWLWLRKNVWNRYTYKVGVQLLSFKIVLWLLIRSWFIFSVNHATSFGSMNFPRLTIQLYNSLASSSDITHKR